MFKLEKARINNSTGGTGRKGGNGGRYSGICIGEQLQGHFRVSRKLALRLRLSQLQSDRERGREGEREDGNRKPTGAEFASGKATSDYFI